MIRGDELDRIYRTTTAKERAILTDIKDCAARGQPVLIGTTMIEDSENCRKNCRRRFGARNPKRQATRPRSANYRPSRKIRRHHHRHQHGRTRHRHRFRRQYGSRKRALQEEQPDGELSPQKIADLENDWKARHEKVLSVGGLRIIGAERNESRRIDNQLRGRSGRQGDPGASIFYLSFEDALLRIFASQRVAKIMETLKIDEDEAIEARMVSRTIENASEKWNPTTLTFADNCWNTTISPTNSGA